MPISRFAWKESVSKSFLSFELQIVTNNKQT